MLRWTKDEKRLETAALISGLLLVLLLLDIYVRRLTAHMVADAHSFGRMELHAHLTRAANPTIDSEED